MQYFRIIFSKTAYQIAYIFAFGSGLCLSLPSVVGSINVVFFTIFPILIILVVVGGLMVHSRDMISTQIMAIFTTISHLCVPFVAISFFVAGLFSANLAVLAYTIPQLKLALALQKSGIEPWTKNIEIISTDPEIAGYVMGFTPVIYGPGETHYVLFDASGKFGDLAEQGREKELIRSENIKARKYQAYCGLHVTKTLKKYYLAVINYNNGC